MQVTDQVLSAGEWQARAEAHANRLEPYLHPHLARRESKVKHPVFDFLFTYYSFRPAQLRRWHPGFGVGLADTRDYVNLKGYARQPDGSVAVSQAHLESQRTLIANINALLAATAGRSGNFGCFGLHEWAMVYRADATRHDWPLRLGSTGTDEVVEGHRIACSHFDAYRFFTPEAEPLNTLRPRSDNRPAFERPSCLHANMDLFKHAARLLPLVSSDLVADCFELAWQIRILDMQASPYDLADLGYQPIRIETSEGKAVYAATQRAHAERAAPLRQRLMSECDRLLNQSART